MKIIKDIISHMESTMGEADEYVSEARLIKDENPTLFTVYIKLAEEHLAHYMSLHSAVVMMINEYKKKGDPPETMKIIWQYEHEKLTEDYEDIRRAIDRAKSM